MSGKRKRKNPDTRRVDGNPDRLAELWEERMRFRDSCACELHRRDLVRELGWATELNIQSGP